MPYPRIHFPLGFFPIFNFVLVILNTEVPFLFCFSCRLTWCHTHVFTSLWPPMLLLSLLRKLTTSSWVLLKSPMLALSQPIRWLNVIHVMENTWPAVCCTVVTWYPRMWMQLLQQSRPREPFSLWTGVQLASRCVFDLRKAKVTLIFSSPSTPWLPCSALVNCPLCDYVTCFFFFSGWNQLPASHSCSWWWPGQGSARCVYVE